MNICMFAPIFLTIIIYVFVSTIVAIIGYGGILILTGCVIIVWLDHCPVQINLNIKLPLHFRKLPTWRECTKMWMILTCLLVCLWRTLVSMELSQVQLISVWLEINLSGSRKETDFSTTWLDHLHRVKVLISHPPLQDIWPFRNFSSLTEKFLLRKIMF